jgi:tight adherence protein C
MSIDPTTLKLIGAGCAASASALALVAWRRARAVAGAATAETSDETPRGPLRRLVAPVATAMRPTNQAELEQLTTLLLTAGRRGRDAVDRYLEERVLAVVSGMVVALAAIFWIGGMLGLFVALGSLCLGLLGPRKHVELRAAARRDAINAALPPAVDLLTTCIEAGLSLEQSIARVARELESPVLADELRTTAKEFEAGVSLPDALRRLARRVGLDDLSALCGVIAQAHGLGAPIGSTLRDYAESSRKQRTSMLEERAGKLAAQLTLPLALCLLPAAMLIIMGPVVVQLVQALQ